MAKKLRVLQNDHQSPQKHHGLQPPSFPDRHQSKCNSAFCLCGSCPTQSCGVQVHAFSRNIRQDVWLTVLFSGQRLSNSFIIAEGDVAHFIIASLYCFYMIRALSSPSRQNSYKHVWKMFSYAHIAIFLTSITGLQTLGNSWVKENT